VHLSRLEEIEHAPTGQGDVHLDVVRFPLIGNGFDSDAGHAELDAVVPHPRVH